jgi:hypothetical protein
MNTQTIFLLPILRRYLKVWLPVIVILLALTSPSLALADNPPNLGTQPMISYWAPAGTQSIDVLVLYKFEHCIPASAGGYHDLGLTGSVGDLIVISAYSGNNCSRSNFLGWAGTTVPSHLINTPECWFDIPHSNVSGCNGATDPTTNNGSGTQPYIRYWAPSGTQSLRVAVLPRTGQFDRFDCIPASAGGYHDLGLTGHVGELIVLTAFSDNKCHNNQFDNVDSLGWAGAVIPLQFIDTANCWFDIPRSNVSGCNGTTDPTTNNGSGTQPDAALHVV